MTLKPVIYNKCYCKCYCHFCHRMWSSSSWHFNTSFGIINVILAGCAGAGLSTVSSAGSSSLCHSKRCSAGSYKVPPVLSPTHVVFALADFSYFELIYSVIHANAQYNSSYMILLYWSSCYQLYNSMYGKQKKQKVSTKLKEKNGVMQSMIW